MCIPFRKQSWLLHFVCYPPLLADEEINGPPSRAVLIEGAFSGCLRQKHVIIVSFDRCWARALLLRLRLCAQFSHFTLLFTLRFGGWWALVRSFLRLIASSFIAFRPPRRDWITANPGCQKEEGLALVGRCAYLSVLIVVFDRNSHNPLSLFIQLFFTQAVKPEFCVASGWRSLIQNSFRGDTNYVRCLRGGVLGPNLTTSHQG